MPSSGNKKKCHCRVGLRFCVHHPWPGMRSTLLTDESHTLLALRVSESNSCEADIAAETMGGPAGCAQLVGRATVA